MSNSSMRFMHKFVSRASKNADKDNIPTILRMPCRMVAKIRFFSEHLFSFNQRLSSIVVLFFRTTGIPRMLSTYVIMVVRSRCDKKNETVYRRSFHVFAAFDSTTRISNRMRQFGDMCWCDLVRLIRTFQAIIRSTHR